MKIVENKTGCLVLRWPESILDWMRLALARGHWTVDTQGRRCKVTFQPILP